MASGSAWYKDWNRQGYVLRDANGNELSFVPEGTRVESTLAFASQVHVPVPTPRKEDEGMFAILQYTHSTPPTLAGTTNTIDEAKVRVEQWVALARGNVAKVFFTYVIVNMKDGTLVGKVVDAPPAIDWSK